MNEIVIEKINEIGMIKIPYNIRKKFNMNFRDKVVIEVEKDKIILEKFKNEDNLGENEIIRVIDELGRVIIPVQIRNLLNIEAENEFEIYSNENRIILSKVK